VINHPNADSLDICTVDGWKVITKRDEYSTGDLCVYCEIDSFLPIRPEFEFLRKSSYKKMGDQEGFRLRTIKLRGELSQGLILPLSILPENVICVLGTDVTAELEIVKYDPPIPAQLAGKIKGNFPSFLRKTDEERIQNLTSEYELWKQPGDHQFYITEKLDGSSATFYFNNGVFGVCSRNLELLESEENSFWRVARQLKLEEWLGTKETNIALKSQLLAIKSHNR